MKIVNDQSASPVTLTEPSTAAYLAACRRNRRAGQDLSRCRAEHGRSRSNVRRPCARNSTERDDVLEAVVFRGALRPPGEGAALLARAGARPARFDVVALIRTRSRDDLDAVRDDAAYRALSAEISGGRTALVPCCGGQRRTYRGCRSPQRRLVSVQLLSRRRPRYRVRRLAVHRRLVPATHGTAELDTAAPTARRGP